MHTFLVLVDKKAGGRWHFRYTATDTLDALRQFEEDPFAPEPSEILGFTVATRKDFEEGRVQYPSQAQPV